MLDIENIFLPIVVYLISIYGFFIIGKHKLLRSISIFRPGVYDKFDFKGDELTIHGSSEMYGGVHQKFPFIFIYVDKAELIVAITVNKREFPSKLERSSADKITAKFKMRVLFKK